MKILAEFNDEDQKFLGEVDRACRVVLDGLKGDARKASLSGEDTMQIDMETAVWLKVTRAYGILYNRAIEASWIRGVVTEIPDEEEFK